MFQIVKRSETELEMLLTETTPAMANSLRRAMLTEVPTMAIEDIEIYENSSSLYDEILAHRLGLVPLKTDLENYVLSEDCSCEDDACPSCSLIFILDREGPGTVFSGDLQSEDPRIFPVSDDIPIVTLAEGERIRMECRARLGRGLEHAKWQPGVVSFRNVHRVEIPEDCSSELVDVCKRGVFALDEYHVMVKDTTRCNACRVCLKVCPDAQIITEDDKFLFMVESNGSLPADDIFLRAVDGLKAKADEFAEKI